VAQLQVLPYEAPIKFAGGVRMARLQNSGRAKDFMTHLHAFRGIAIILIVGAHAPTMVFWGLGVQGEPNPDLTLIALNETLMHNSTIFFAFISGLLFATVLFTRGWKNFFKSKFLNVMLPYCLFSLLFTMFHWDIVEGFSIFSGSWAGYLEEVGDNILSGQASFQLWYIPVLTILFAVTPLMAWLMQREWAHFLMAALLVVPIFVSRTFPDNSVANVFVFLAPYTFGIWLGFSYEQRIKFVERLQLPLAAITIVASVATFYLYVSEYGPMSVAGIEPDGAVNWYESASYVQKMGLLCLVLLWLRSREGWLPGWLNQLASHAFAIYFMHVFLLLTWLAAANSWLTEPPSVPVQILVAAAIWIAVLGACVAISTLVQRLLGRRSRMLIGS
jgi:surface polysaccharide O-acyltransferase-like enzyme